MENINRNFKGVWIPKEIWETNTLNIQEKVILIEIDSLESEEKGCYASNKYFSSFFNLSTGRVSQIINNLQKKGYITIKYETKDKQIINREIRTTEVFRKLNRGIKYSKEGYLENAKENNIGFNNSNNILSKDEKASKKELEETKLTNDFELIWKEYPRKDGRGSAFKSYKAYIKGTKLYCGRKIKLDNKQMWLAVRMYADECEENKTEKQYIKMGSTFFNETIVEYVEKVENRNG